jgi:hypothetical protein
MAIANSSASTALEGGDLGWRKAGELPSLFAEEVLDLDIGETADPIETGGGIHIVQLLDVRGASTQSEQQAQVRHILVQPSEIRTEEGYMAEVQPDPEGAAGTWLLVENHCPICHAAKACTKLCAQELTVFREVLGDAASVERTDHILAGARRCAYRVRPIRAGKTVSR